MKHVIGFIRLILTLSLLSLAACGGGSGGGGGTSAPAAPAGLTATTTSATAIDLSWAASNGATGYDVYRATTANQALAAMTKLTVSPTASAAYTDSTLAAGTAYFYKVVAIYANGSSAASVEATANTPLQMGGAMQGVALNIPFNGGVVTTLAGTAGVPGSADGTGTAALFNRPRGITTDGLNLYVTDYYNHTIRQIVITTGVVTTLAGKAGTIGSADDQGTAALFYYPSGITTDGVNLYVADSFNHTIRQIEIASGQVTTLAGTPGGLGSTDGTGSAATFRNPSGITTDGVNLYVADNFNHTIRQIEIATKVVTTLAGTAGTTGSADGTGTAASFSFPLIITTDGIHLYVTDYNNHTIRQIVIATRVVTTLAGKAATFGSADGTGDAAKFYFPAGISTDGVKLYVSDYFNHTIRQIQ